MKLKILKDNVKGIVINQGNSYFKKGTILTLSGSILYNILDYNQDYITIEDVYQDIIIELKNEKEKVKII